MAIKFDFNMLLQSMLNRIAVVWLHVVDYCSAQSILHRYRSTQTITFTSVCFVANGLLYAQ